MSFMPARSTLLVAFIAGALASCVVGEPGPAFAASARAEASRLLADAPLAAIAARAPHTAQPKF